MTLKFAFEFIVSCLQVFWNGAGLSDRGHKIHVADPARQNMLVKMAGDARAGGFAEIHPDIITIRGIGIAQSGLALFG